MCRIWRAFGRGGLYQGQSSKGLVKENCFLAPASEKFDAQAITVFKYVLMIPDGNCRRRVFLHEFTVIDGKPSRRVERQAIA